jgi:hypothetical protein
MKKLIATLAIAVLALTSTFAVDSTLSFSGSSQAAPEMNVTLKSSLAQTPYDLTIIYGDSDFTEAGSTELTGLDLTVKDNTSLFNIMISEGNLNNTITFTTEITLGNFIGEVDGDDTYNTENVLSILGPDYQPHATSFSSVLKAGPQVSQSIAAFAFAWTAFEDLPAGDYVSTNKINVKVN